MSTVRIHEIYRSIQGESSFAGLACVFVRTTGCPLRCVWCDTEYAFQGGAVLGVDTVVSRVLAWETPLVEVTGGEPLAQPAVPDLLVRLADAGRTVLLETAGAHDISTLDPRVHVILDVKCPGSGMADRTYWPNLERVRPHHEVKFVIGSREDYEYARGVIREHALGDRCEVLLSPVFGAIDRREVVAWMLEDHLSARFQLQLHKLVWPPRTKGV